VGDGSAWPMPILSAANDRAGGQLMCSRSMIIMCRHDPAVATLTRVRARYGHDTRARWTSGCRCPACRQAHANSERSRKRANAQTRLPAKVRQRLLNGIYAGTPFRTVARDLGLTSQQVWGLTKTDQAWSTALDAALTAARRDNLEHGTNAAYVNGCLCGDCREHQQRRMGRNRI
jgi:hypothetical protein